MKLTEEKEGGRGEHPGCYESNTSRINFFLQKDVTGINVSAERTQELLSQ